jgi:hypothetical protein
VLLASVPRAASHMGVGLDDHPSSLCERVGLEAEADRMQWSQPRQLPPAVDSTLDPMLVEAAIHVLPPNRRSVVVDDPCDV